ncbi:PIR Superfamily Protein [Plasmodium ovale wallikeri]|uniref:PIR Superfamily Protein n=1 Tax=Plasmodium ovale wallikeri TaxID=864142 RepID=A0A1A9AQI5_PLAOA|nr:PIR Superfamily Protein [Plasmodium ovale wallikeri]SBT59335.1 PIR Superfamily Protein [Plasmodium ovale wallikeri]
MTEGITMNYLPSKKYKNELENGIHYQEVEQNMEDDRLTTKLGFWSTVFPQHLFNYFNNHISGWTEDNKEKRCRDLNYLLDFILKRIKAKEETNSLVPYKLIESYINNAAELYLKPWSEECQRNSKLNTHYEYIENLKKIDDFCEDIAYLEKNISEIRNNDCKQIETYIDEQIAILKPLYATSGTEYSDILEYYNFKSFDYFNSKITNLKSKCQEGTTGTSLVGDQGGMQPYSDRSASIIAVTSLSGILSSFFLLYKTTSFGSILNTLIRNKIKFGNNLSDEAYYETLKDIPESSHDGAYNILYNSVGDS